jgi:hypothetical protein
MVPQGMWNRRNCNRFSLYVSSTAWCSLPDILSRICLKALRSPAIHFSQSGHRRMILFAKTGNAILPIDIIFRSCAQLLRTAAISSIHGGVDATFSKHRRS